MAEQHLLQDAVAQPKSPQVINECFLLHVVLGSGRVGSAGTRTGCGDSSREASTGGHCHCLLLLLAFGGISGAPGSSWATERSVEIRDTCSGAGTRYMRSRPCRGLAGRGAQEERLAVHRAMVLMGR